MRRVLALIALFAGCGDDANGGIIIGGHPVAQVPVQFTPIGPYGDSIGLLAGGAANPSVIYAVTPYAGTGSVARFYRSSDGGGSWDLLNTLPNDQGVAALAVAPSDPSSVYVVTAGGGHILVSANSGDQFELRDLFTTFPMSHRATTIALASNDPGIAYALSPDGIFKTTDSGVSWTQISSMAETAIAVAESDSNTVYVAGTNGVFKSTDAGATFTSISTTTTYTSIVVDPTSASFLYLLGSSAVFSSDGGATWNTTTVPGSLCFTRGSPRSLFSVGSHVYLGTPGQANWTQLPDPPQPIGPAWSASLASPLCAGDGAVYAAGVESILKTTDLGQTWTPSRTGLEGASAGRLAVDPLRPGGLYATTALGLFSTTDDGTSWTSALFFSNDIWVDPTRSGVAYALLATGAPPAYRSYLLTTTDAGATWTMGPELGPDAPSTGFVVSPTNPNRWYAFIQRPGPDSQTCGFARSDDAGTTWTMLPLPPSSSPGASNYCGIEMALAVSAVSMDTVFISGRPGVFVSNDGGSTWNSHSLATPSGQATAGVFAVVGPNVFAAAGEIFLSTDEGASWRMISQQLESMHVFVHSMAVDPANPDVIYLGDEMGLVRTTDGAASWQRILSSQMNPPGSIVASRQEAGVLYVAQVGGEILKMGPAP